MASSLHANIADLSSPDNSVRAAAAVEIYRMGRTPADHAVYSWWADPELSALSMGPKPLVTVGLAVTRETFANIRKANRMPRLANVPADQDAEEFELHFSEGVFLDVLTTREPGGNGAIARYLERFGEGVQQVEYRCLDVERATELLKEKYGVVSVYPHSRLGADGTRINFFLVPTSSGSKVLIELYQLPTTDHSSPLNS